LKRKGHWPVLNWGNLALILLGGALLALYRHGLQAEGQGVSYVVWFIKLALVQSALYFGAALTVWRAGRSRSTLVVVVVFAALFRLSILFSTPMSDDIYRYIWDGRVQAAGINPYRYVPADEALAGLRDEAVYAHINRRDNAHTIYPPIAQAFFFLVTRVSESVTWMKTAMVGCEAVALVALASLLASFGWPRARVLIFAWHPLIVWEIAGSGHVDALMIALVALALVARRNENHSVAGIALACATLIKFFPVVLFPGLYRRWRWKMPVAFATTICLAYAPYLSVGAKAALGFLPVYAEQEGLESGERFFILALARKVIAAGVPNSVYTLLGLGLLCFIAAWSLRKGERSDTGFLAASCILASAFTVLLAPHYPWYFAWIVPFMCFVPAAALFYLTAASFVLYGTWLGDAPEQLFRLNAALYLPFALLALIGLAVRHAIRWRSRSDGRRVGPLGGEVV
jgi:alpha-1,6-mannosyltransferase